MSVNGLNEYPQQRCRGRHQAEERARTTAKRPTAPAPESTLNEMFDHLVCKLCGAKNPREALINLILLEGEDAIDGVIGAACQINGANKLRFTREFVCARGLDEDQILAWLAENYLRGDEERCDCLTLRLLTSYVAGY